MNFGKIVVKGGGSPRPRESKRQDKDNDNVRVYVWQGAGWPGWLLQGGDEPDMEAGPISRHL